MYLIIQDNYVLGGDTVDLERLLKGLGNDEYFLIYCGSKMVTHYIKNMGIPESVKKEFEFRGTDYLFHLVKKANWIPNIANKIIGRVVLLLRPIIDYSLAKKIERFLGSLKLDKVNKLVINSGGYFGTGVTRQFIKQTRFPCIYMLHNHIPKQYLNNKKKLESVSKYVDHWIVGSKVIQNQLIDYCSANKNGISLVHYGVKPRFFPDEKLRSRTRKKLKITEDAFVVLHPSNFDKRKGHYFTISAFRELLSKHPIAKLILAGNDGYDFEHVTTLIRKYKISDSVLLPGFYSPFEELLSVVDVLCLPSQEFDTTPYVILLALACKIPVITTDREDFADILFDGYNALLVPTGNYKSISTKLIDLAEGKVDIEELTKNGEETYQRLFREESMVSEKVNLIRTI